ncbi:peroxiredoxin-like family protein [Gilliamella sp. ESL0443]|uniref:peroxiredoxin-like family protein n=1 Tax=Gilliamella sp. ESL0443 TaxID=2704655 RepID=UPI001C6A3E36|nr:peroxiredoxin-like family protein [Gilliamella sp. ESL0443]QYN42503.1 AhpC/TSA family protein [Gilliamella sp. ESL0443]
MKLIKELTEIQHSMATQLPADVLNIMSSSLSEMLSQKLDINALTCGDTAPDFTLKSTNQSNVNLYELLKTKPVIISFFRGSWCPFCLKELEHYQKNLVTENKSILAHFLAISPQKTEISSQLCQNNNISLTILSDQGNEIAKKYGLVFTLPNNIRPLYKNLGADLPDFNGDNNYQLPIPATYIIDQNKKIIFSYINVNYMERVDISELQNVLQNY